MSRKYIKQVDEVNFVYPNNLIYEYDTEIIHDINDNSVSGYTSGFTISSLTSTGLTFNYDLTWVKNNAEIYKMINGDYSLVSIHLMPAGELYYTPWKMVANFTEPSSYTGTSENYVGSVTVSNTDLQISGFTAGDYYFNIRFIGHRAVYPICVKINAALATPTPTPTSTNTPTPTPTATNTPTPTPTATFTPTPTGPTDTPTPTPSPTVEYDYYDALYNDCLDCSGSTSYILVAFPAGSSVTLNRYYIPVGGPDGLAYKVTNSTSYGTPAYLLTTSYGSFATCTEACAA